MWTVKFSSFTLIIIITIHSIRNLQLPAVNKRLLKSFSMLAFRGKKLFMENLRAPQIRLKNAFPHEKQIILKNATPPIDRPEQRKGKKGVFPPSPSFISGPAEGLLALKNLSLSPMPTLLQLFYFLLLRFSREPGFCLHGAAHWKKCQIKFDEKSNIFWSQFTI